MFSISARLPETSFQYIPNLTNLTNSSDYEVNILSNFTWYKPTLKITEVHEVQIGIYFLKFSIAHSTW